MVTVPARFRGPPTSANGGWACGLCADGRPAAEVTLRKPIPLDTPLERDEGRLMLAGEALAEAVPVSLELAVPAAPSFEAALEAGTRYIGLRDHAFPGCFVCGPGRAEGDGLRLFPGRMPLEGIPGGVGVAAAWTPHASLAEGEVLPAEIVWAALDCPSWFGAVVDLGEATPRVALLGRLAAELREPVRVGVPHVVTAWPLGIDGRKVYGGAAVHGPDGRWLARGRATWVVLKS
jgi:hypothetical protein